MARQNAFKLTSTDLPDLNAKLARLTGEQIGLATVEAVNKAADKIYDLSRDRITSGINLTDSYLRRKMEVRPATEAKPEATISASGAREAISLLREYDARMLQVPRKTNTPSRGRGALGIPTGLKQGGVRVEVTRGSQKFMEGAFLLPLRRGKEAGGNGFGVFLRGEGKGLSHRYGPSVYQLFRYQIENYILGASEEILNQQLLEEVDRITQKVTEA